MSEFTEANIIPSPQETIAEIEKELLYKGRPSVSLEALQRLTYGKYERVKRYSNVPIGETKYEQAIKTNPQYQLQSPYDIWGVYYGSLEKPLSSNPVQDMWEYRVPVKAVPWMPYILSTFVQPEPQRFLEYLRLIQCSTPNPWVAIIGAAKGNRFWVDRITGEKLSTEKQYAHLSMYPHVRMKDGTRDFRITFDRFKETAVSYALKKAFTIRDIARINDPDLLERAYSSVLNRLPQIKAWIADESIVTLIKDGKVQKKVQVSLHPKMQKILHSAINDLLDFIKDSIDVLAESAIETRALQQEGITRDFIGPEWYNPLTKADITDAEIEAGLAKQPIRTEFNIPSQFSIMPPALSTVPQEDVEITDTQKKPNLILPVAAAGAAALGLYAATR